MKFEKGADQDLTAIFEPGLEQLVVLHSFKALRQAILNGDQRIQGNLRQRFLIRRNLTGLIIRTETHLSERPQDLLSVSGKMDLPLLAIGSNELTEDIEVEVARARAFDTYANKVTLNKTHRHGPGYLPAVGKINLNFALHPELEERSRSLLVKQVPAHVQ